MQVDYSEQDLRGRDFSGQDLTGADLTGANMTLAILYGADLTNAVRRLGIRRADLEGAEGLDYVKGLVD